jgi:hypothetical protein
LACVLGRMCQGEEGEGGGGRAWGGVLLQPCTHSCPHPQGHTATPGWQLGHFMQCPPPAPVPTHVHTRTHPHTPVRMPAGVCFYRVKHSLILSQDQPADERERDELHSGSQGSVSLSGLEFPCSTVYGPPTLFLRP